MSVYTEQDEKRDAARKSIQTAIECLSDLVAAPRSEFNDLYQERMRRALDKLLQARDDIGRP